MTEDLNAIPLIIRREIEAQIAVPIMQAFAEELGEEKAKAIGSRVIKEMAEESGRQLAIGMGDNGLKSFARTLSIFTQGGALEMDVLEQTDTRLSFNVTRCRYAETYRELGMIDYGTTLSCHRDFAPDRWVQSRRSSHPDPNHHGRGGFL